MSKKRYELFDAWRGLALIGMIGYHFSYDLFVLYGLYPGFLRHPLVELWQQTVCISFILLCGLCASFSRNLLKRGILLNLFGLIITGITVIATPSAAVWFGVLNFLGCALLLLIPVKKLVDEKNWLFAGILSFVLFLLFRHITWGYIGIGDLQLITLPDSMYTTKILTPFGFPYPEFTSSDYFPILPWFFLFFTGYCLSYSLKKSERIQEILTYKIPGLSWIGKHSLVIYMVHQPILMAICMLIFGF